jgi:hypothetical protein
MTTKVKPEVYARALKVAEGLRQQLEERLIGKSADGWSCSCGACSYGFSKVVGISMSTWYQYQIAMWTLWICNMRDNHGKGWGQGIITYIPWAELYPMFRNAFAGIDVRVEHPFAAAYNDHPDLPFGYLAAREGRIFTGSGRFVEVDNETPAYVRPIGDLTHCAWVNAELRVDTNVPGYTAGKPLVACNVDPFEFGGFRGRGMGQYYNATDPAEWPTVYVRIPGGGGSRDLYRPVGRMVAIDKATSKATFELDQSVEIFDPVAPASAS